MLNFTKKEWYLENKEFLREFEKTTVFKNYRNIRNKVKRLDNRIIYLKNILDNIESPKKIQYLLFFYKKLKKLNEKKKRLFLRQEKSFIIMKNAKSKSEIKFLKSKVSILTKKTGEI